jgi:hypothetical protein
MENTVMKIINRIVEAEMTASEQVELTRLEDEVSQARDEVSFCQDDYNHARDYQTGLDLLVELKHSRNVLDITINNLNNYIDVVTKRVMQRITVTDV